MSHLSRNREIVQELRWLAQDNWFRRYGICLFGWLLVAGCDCKDSSSRPDSSSLHKEAIGVGHSFLYEGPLPQHFGEAPSLTLEVEAGRLPPLAARLPRQPLVVPPVERIGKYGGTWHRAFTGPGDGQNIERILHDHVVYYDLDGSQLVPHIAKSWEVDEEGRVFTFYLREEMKWSDGHPFTADDFLFAFNEMLLNKDLNPDQPRWARTQNGIGQISKIDDYTICYTFPDPYAIFIELAAGHMIGGQSTRPGRIKAPFAPFHYLKQFHPKYVSEEKLSRLTAEAGFIHWTQLFVQQADMLINSELPVVAPWKIVQPITSQTCILQRNPYYFAVDPDGNQLPYIDRIVLQLATNLEVLNLRAVTGELDMQHRHINLAKVPVLHAFAKQGEYRVLLWPTRSPTDCGIFINQDYATDQEVAHWLRNLDFRIALSLAIDREAIQDLIFLGTGTIRSAVVASDSPYTPGAEYEQKFTQHDPQKANAILDRSGLIAKDSQGYRLRADGRGRLRLQLAVVDIAYLDFTGIAQLLTEHWARIGLQVEVSVEEQTLFQVRSDGNEHQMRLWDTIGAEELWSFPWYTIPLGQVGTFAPLAGKWYASRGQRGVEPSGAIRRLVDLYDQGKSLPLKGRIPLAREIWRIHADNLFVIGTIASSPAANGVVVVKNYFRNVPSVAPNSPVLQTPGIARPEQFFFDR